jgi:hypothetical protein
MATDIWLTNQVSYVNIMNGKYEIPRSLEHEK